eukprot:Polyplicarium_translucidae@DN430_c0_g1_i1.p1
MRTLVTFGMWLAVASKPPVREGGCFKGESCPRSLPRAMSRVPAAGLPPSFDWRDVDGVSYVTRNLNQHIPHYCGSCWAHGAISTVSDRIKVLRRGQYPDVILSIQSLINCGTAGSCHGGSEWKTWRYLAEFGLPDETCQLYDAMDHECSPLRMCEDCYGPVDDGDANCVPLDTFKKYFVKDFGTIPSNDTDAMKSEIFARGPIACGVDSASIFHHHKVPEIIDRPGYELDHVVSVAGWGESAEGVAYWIVRNSWGTYWGEEGWFRVRMGTNSLLIESQCSWVMPDWPPRVVSMDDDIKRVIDALAREEVCEDDVIAIVK